MVKQFQSALKSLVKEMSRPNPDPNKANQTQTRASTPSMGLSARVSDGPASSRFFNASGVEHLIDALNRREAWDHVTSWDEAAQRAILPLVPLNQTRGRWDTGRRADQRAALSDELRARLKSLTFPKGFDSPRGFDPGRIPARHSEGSDVPVKDREARAFP